MLKKNCEFAEQVVAYIYDEASAKERKEFESHLMNCLPCADEIAGFGLVRSELNEWRKEEFFAPALKNPAVRPIVATSENGSWIDSLRRLFSPAWAGGFAVLLVALGLVWFFYGNSKIDTIAVLPPNIEQKSVEQPKEAEIYVSNPQPEIRVVPQNVKQVEQKTIVPKNQIVKMVNKPKSVQPKMDKLMADNKANKNNKPNYVPRKDAPKLVEITEDEDESLRLSELFDEIGSSN